MNSVLAIQPVTEETNPRLAIVRTEVSELSLRAVLLVAMGASVLFVMTAGAMTSYSALVDRFGDSAAYMNIAAAIRHWDFGHIVVKQFWGYSYGMAIVSILTSVSDRVSLLVISYVCYLVSVALAQRLWGGWVAAFFAVLNFDWLQRAMLGGSEPLFVALLLAAFLAARRKRWLAAASLASLATVVRPLGIFALLGIAVVLLRRRQFAKLAVAIAIGLVIAGLYVWPLARHFGDPLATVHSYQSSGSSRSLFGIPFYAIVEGTILYPAPWTNLVLSFLWIGFVTAGAFAMIVTKSFREYAKSFPVEALFVLPYLWMIYAYNYPVFARSNFARFAIPVIPFVLIALQKWVPRNRFVLGGLAVVSPILAAVSALGLQNVLQRLR